MMSEINDDDDDDNDASRFFYGQTDREVTTAGALSVRR